MKLLTNCLRQAVYWLQNDAEENYERDRRIKIVTKSNETKIIYVSRPLPTIPSQRMLGDIVNDSKLTYRIHGLFVWLLRIANGAIKETLFYALPTEEQTTRQERIGREKYTITERKIRCLDAFDDDDLVTSITKCERLTKFRTNKTQDPLIISMTLTNISNNTNYLATSLYSTISSYCQNEYRSYNDDYDLLEDQFSSYGRVALQLFELFVRKLNSTKYLQYILCNWVIGNRLIIKYTNRIDGNESICHLASIFRVKTKKE